MSTRLVRRLVMIGPLAMLSICSFNAIAQQRAPRLPLAPSMKSNAPADNEGAVLLTNQNILRGNAVQQGNEIVVSRNDGSEIRLPRQRVLCWGKSILDLYRFRIDQRQPNDLAAYVADIQWCINNEHLAPELLEVAKVDLEQVQQHAPNNHSLRRLSLQLSRQLLLQASRSQPVIRMPQADRDARAEEIRRVDHQQELARASQELDRDTLAGFARDVQPLLLNRCGTCHSQQTDRNWTLLVPAKGSRASARMTRENLVATSKYLNFDQALESELRIRALDGHAGEDNSLGMGDSVSASALDRWLKMAQPGGSRLEMAVDNLTKPSAPKPLQLPTDPKRGNADDAAATETSRTKSPGIERLPQVANPFDPSIFNRRQELR